MSRLLSVYTTVFILALGTTAFAQEEPVATESTNTFEDRLKNLQDPFQAKLPIVEEEVADTRVRPKPSGKQETITKPEPNKDGDKKASDSDSNTQGTTQPDKLVGPEPEPIIEIEPLPNVVVSGIIWDSDRPQAIVDGLIVDIGDTIFGIQVTDINKTGIIGMFHGRSVYLTSQRSPL